MAHGECTWPGCGLILIVCSCWLVVGYCNWVFNVKCHRRSLGRLAALAGDLRPCGLGCICSVATVFLCVCVSVFSVARIFQAPSFPFITLGASPDSFHQMLEWPSVSPLTSQLQIPPHTPAHTRPYADPGLLFLLRGKEWTPRLTRLLTRPSHRRQASRRSHPPTH
jgi:hypothetical protein